MDTKYWQAIKQRVCKKCLDGDGYGNCLIDPSIDCTLELYFPKIVDIVGRIKSDNVEHYLQELRVTVCSECKYQTIAGECRLRPDIECALDRYFPLIVQTLEGVSQQTAV